MKETKVKISCRNLCKVFGPRPNSILNSIGNGLDKEEILEQSGHVVAVRDISFDVHEGEIFVIMGLSGSGKSTLIRCINRLIEPTRGEICIDGVDLAKMKDTELRNFRRKKISMVFQHFALFPNRSVLDNIAYGLEIQGINKKQRSIRAMETLETVGLVGWGNAYPGELSGGMAQRVGLARALCVDPAILLMDEAFSALDPLIRRELQDEFVDLMDRAHKTTLFVTHDLSEALKLGDRIAIMRDGEFIQVGSPEELVSKPANEFVEDFIRDIPRGKVILVRNIMDEPKLVLYDWQGPQVALFAMRAKNIDHAFIVGVKRKFKGVVTLPEIREAVNRNVKRLEEVIGEGTPQIEPDRPIEEAARIAAASEKPLAAVDAAGNLLGEVQPEALLSAMAGEEVEDEDKNAKENEEREEISAQERLPDEGEFEATNN
jgi:glycine betaine/proline transport system ATP-binding protein